MADDAAALGHANLIAYSGESGRWSPAGQVADAGGVLLYATGSWIPIDCNGAFRRTDDVDPTEVVSRAEEFFGSMDRGYCVRIRDTGQDDDLREACEKAGLALFGDPAPEMILDARLPDAPPPDGVQLRVITTEDEVTSFGRVNGEAYSVYGMPTDQPPALFSNPAAVLACRDLVTVMAFRDGEPVAGAQTYLSHGIAGVYWVGTVSAARGQGLGEAVTRMATNIGFDRCARVVTLQASPMGEPIYRRLGYRVGYRYANYVRWPAFLT